MKRMRSMTLVAFVFIWGQMLQQTYAEANYQQAPVDRGCCSSSNSFHRRCHCDSISDDNACQSLCTSDAGCKGYVMLEQDRDYCQLATTSSCPVNCRGPYDNANVGPIDPNGQCGTAALWNGGCRIKDIGEENKRAIAELQKEISKIKSEMDTLQIQKKEENKKIQEKQAEQQEKINAMMKEKEREKSMLQEKLNSIMNETDDLAKEMSTEKVKMKELEDDVKAEKAKTKALEEDVQAEKAKTKKLEEAVKVVKFKIKKLEDAAKEEKNKLNSIKNETIDLAKEMSTEKVKMKQLEDDVKAEKAKTKALEEDVKAEKAKTKKLEDDVKAEKAKTKALEEDVKAEKANTKKQEEAVKAEQLKIKKLEDAVKEEKNKLRQLEQEVMKLQPGKFWPEETEDKYCPNSQTFKDVSNQAECQDKCEAQSSCVGISYSHQDAANRTWCYVCKDDVLRGAANDFGFYRRPAVCDPACNAGGATGEVCNGGNCVCGDAADAAACEAGQLCNAGTCEESEKCCSELQVTSNGWSKDARSRQWGMYEIMEKRQNGANVYKQTRSNNFLYLSTSGKWTISDDIDGDSGYIKHYSCYRMCPESCSSSWETYNNTEDPWTVDDDLLISCGYTLKHNVYCAGRDINDYSTALEAQRACSLDNNCQMIDDRLCDGKGPFTTCEGHVTHVSTKGSCVWIKSNGSAISMSSNDFNGVFTTPTDGEIRIQLGQNIESKEVFSRPITVEAEMKTDGSTECITMSLFADNANKNGDISLEIGYWGSKWRIFPGDDKGEMGPADRWRKVKMELDDSNGVKFYIDDSEKHSTTSGKTEGKLRFIPGCESMLIRNIKVVKREP